MRGSFHLDVVSTLAALDDGVCRLSVALLPLLLGRGASLRIPAPLSSVRCKCGGKTDDGTVSVLMRAQPGGQGDARWSVRIAELSKASLIYSHPCL